jgi:FkbM family methyltransferase
MRTLHRFEIDGIALSAYDRVGSQSAQWIAWELQADDYRLRQIQFEEGDVIVDIGAHVGLFSMYLAKRWPCVTVYAFEPFPENFVNCAENLRLNNVINVVLSQKAISGDSRPLDMASSPHNSGGASAIESTFGSNAIVRGIPSMTLDEVFSVHAIDHCRLLKIDCEGMEYEVLLGAGVLEKVEYLAGEFHASACMKNLGWWPHRLRAHCESFFARDRLTIQFNRLEEYS